MNSVTNRPFRAAAFAHPNGAVQDGGHAAGRKPNLIGHHHRQAPNKPPVAGPGHHPGQVPAAPGHRRHPPPLLQAVRAKELPRQHGGPHRSPRHYGGFPLVDPDPVNMSRRTGKHFNKVAEEMALFLNAKGGLITHVNLVATRLLPTHLPKVTPEPGSPPLHPRPHEIRQGALKRLR